MKYKVGDIVKLRDDLVSGKVYGGIAYTGYMDYLKKQPSTIETCIEDSLPNRYKTKETWVITDEMIQGLWEECKGIAYEPYKEKTNKYKLIDILNKIANGELKEGTKVKYKDIDLIYEDEELVDDEGFSAADFFRSKADYNEEVELIEPDHFADIGEMAEHLRDDTKMIEPTDNTKIEELVIDEIDINCLGIHSKTILLNIIDKLNEVIRYKQRS